MRHAVGTDPRTATSDSAISWVCAGRAIPHAVVSPSLRRGLRPGDNRQTTPLFPRAGPIPSRQAAAGVAARSDAAGMSAGHIFSIFTSSVPPVHFSTSTSIFELDLDLRSEFSRRGGDRDEAEFDELVPPPPPPQDHPPGPREGGGDLQELGQAPSPRLPGEGRVRGSFRGVQNPQKRPPPPPCGACHRAALRGPGGASTSLRERGEVKHLLTSGARSASRARPRATPRFP